MILTKQYARGLLVLAVAALSLLNLTPTFAADKAVLIKNSEAALQSLYGKEPLAKAISDKAAGVLVFPHITKAGFIVGGSSGDGILFKNDQAVGLYKTSGVSIGFQAGGQSFGYAVFFVTDSALEKFQARSGGWDSGVEANVVVAKKGAAAEATAETAKSEIVAFVFDQKGVMGGISLGGQKVTKVESIDIDNANGQAPAQKESAPAQKESAPAQKDSASTKSETTATGSYSNCCWTPRD